MDKANTNNADRETRRANRRRVMAATRGAEYRSAVKLYGVRSDAELFELLARDAEREMDNVRSKYHDEYRARIAEYRELAAIA